ncbi:UDP-N-acetylmuramoyl-L-alanine--D-glutamate ligase [Timonella sp. A28]|uniref:UDP-N-acetylmuramoyl-L-alanine--D-glutamate ligase n=1 Tax=Timonella sp. A28 TaxID=3442640 RepID=UPI003EBE4046
MNVLAEDARVLVVGLGVTGKAVVAALTDLDTSVRPTRIATFDTHNPNADFHDVQDIEISDFNLVIASPGWAPHNPIFVHAAHAGIPIWSEIELAWNLRVPRAGTTDPAPWVGVTGTNGKTTTVQMLESICAADGKNVALVGNVGRPVIEVAQDPKIDVVALELSSFQLHFTHSMELEAAALINIAPDHVDWHGSFENYVSDKARIYSRVKTACIYNADVPLTRSLVEQADVADGARAVGFTLGAPQRGEIGLVEDVIVDRAFHLPQDDAQRHHSADELATFDDLAHLAGSAGTVPPHAVANALAASAVARAIGVSALSVKEGLRLFVPGQHRMAHVATTEKLFDGTPGRVAFINDSKATNAHAAAASLTSFSASRIVWIAGGLAKGTRFDDLVAAHASTLRAAVIIGVDQEPLRDAFRRHAPTVPIQLVDSRETETVMERAVAAAYEIACDGDVVLLAPACASMDQFDSYAERGLEFTRCAQQVAEANQN